ncbi:MAG: hypothetical protein K0T99_03550 [Alphaproteobacteria bacterium]|nr:hypothetical protein [Alphaproteobacteria bacterium]
MPKKGLRKNERDSRVLEWLKGVNGEQVGAAADNSGVVVAQSAGAVSEVSLPEVPVPQEVLDLEDDVSQVSMGDISSVSEDSSVAQSVTTEGDCDSVCASCASLVSEHITGGQSSVEDSA